MRRHEIKDEDWERIKDMLPGQPSDPGVTAKDNRLFINAVLSIGKTGAPWRDLPERDFGNLSGLDKIAEIVIIAGKRHSNFNQGGAQRWKIGWCLSSVEQLAS